MSTATTFSRQNDASSWILRKSCSRSRPRPLQSKFSNKYMPVEIIVLWYEKDRKRAQPFSFSQKRATGRFQRIPWAARLAWWIQNRLSQIQNWTVIVFICIVKNWCPEHFQFFLTFLKALQLHLHDNETRTLINSDNLPQNGSLRFSGNCQNLSKLNIKLSGKVPYSRKKD